MSEKGSLINIDLSGCGEAAKVLVEKISDGVGGFFHPYQIKKIAQAEAEADKIRVISQIEITELQRRAVTRFIAEEAQKQHNMESVITKALPALEEGKARPQDVEQDWITNFFDKCRLISNEQMQDLWSKILAGEANSPGAFSKRTVNLLASFDQSDAQLFTNLCSFNWLIGEELVPLVFQGASSVYSKAGIFFGSLKHLDEIGVITFAYTGTGDYTQRAPERFITVGHHSSQIEIELPVENNGLEIGQVLFSRAGLELAQICDSQEPPAGFKEFVIQHWLSLGCTVRELSSDKALPEL